MPGINEKGATSDVCHNCVCVCEKEFVDGRVLKKINICLPQYPTLTK